MLALAKAETITLVGTATTALEEQLHTVTKRNKALKGMVKEMVHKVAEYQASFEQLQAAHTLLQRQHSELVQTFDEHLHEYDANHASSPESQHQPQPEIARADGDRTPEAAHKRQRLEQTTVASGSDTNREAVNAATSGQPQSCPASIIAESL